MSACPLCAKSNTAAKSVLDLPITLSSMKIETCSHRWGGLTAPHRSVGLALSLFRASDLVQQGSGRLAEVALSVPQSRERTFGQLERNHLQIPYAQARLSHEP